MNTERLINQLKQDEGYRRFPYKCTAGKLTIGFGRNIEDNGIDEEEAEHLLRNDVSEVRQSLLSVLAGHDDIRQEVVVNMAFNLGVPTLLKFKNMLAAFAAHNYHLAADEMVNSLWYKQVGDRAKRLVKMMRTGQASS